MRIYICMIATVILCVVACASGDSRLSSQEVKNSSSHLTKAEQRFFESKRKRLRDDGHSIAPQLRQLALALDAKVAADEGRTQEALKVAEVALRDVIQRDVHMSSVSFTTGNYLSPISVSKRPPGIEAKVDLSTREEGLREQIGFFPEAPNAPVEELEGYPRVQFAVTVTRAKRMRIRIPILLERHYLGDLIGEYDRAQD